MQSFGECAGWPGLCAVYSGSHKVNVKLDTVSASINYRFSRTDCYNHKVLCNLNGAVCAG